MDTMLEALRKANLINEDKVLKERKRRKKIERARIKEEKDWLRWEMLKRDQQMRLNSPN